MIKAMGKSRIEFSYFSLYLKRHLQDIGDSRADDADFINDYAERAEVEFEECRRDGYTVDQAQERAMSVLTSGVS